VATPRDREGCRADGSILDALSSGYIRRAGARLPRQGVKAPWRVMHHYPSDRVMLLHEPIDDGVLEFAPRRAPDIAAAAAHTALAA
jgi:hypothetical protein